MSAHTPSGLRGAGAAHVSHVSRVGRVGVVDDPSFDLHRAPPGHPERPERLIAARSALTRANIAATRIASDEASDEQLARAHTSDYIHSLTPLRGKEGQLDADTYVAPGSIEAARRAAGGACNLIDALLDDRIDQGIALLRPPGHHARPSEAMGFCLINNVAVAAAHARSRGIDRVLVVDWDVHHGNGTQEIFWDDPHVLYASLHQWPFYPGTGAANEVGAGEGRGFTVNVPLSAGAADGDYAAAFERIILPVAEEYAPELVLISAGFDAHRRDPLASMRLEADSYARFTTMLKGVADRSAAGRIAVMLEGGYDLGALESSLAACIKALTSPSADPGAPDTATVATPTPAPPSPSFEGEIERARRCIAEFWPHAGKA